MPREMTEVKNYTWLVLLENLAEVTVDAHRHHVTEEGVLRFDAKMPSGDFLCSQSFAAGCWRQVSLVATLATS